MSVQPMQPQDHQAPKPKAFTFKAGRKTYKLPPITEAHPLLSGGDLIDAALEGDVGQMTYLIKSLTAVASPETLAALRSMTQPEMLEVLSDWGEYGDGTGVGLGESGSSSR